MKWQELEFSGGGRRDYTGIVSLLEASGRDVVTLRFKEIEVALGFSLPASARRYQAWWANSESHPASRTWMRAGWRSFDLSLERERVSFREVASAEQISGGQRPSSVPPASGPESIAAPLVRKKPSLEESRNRIGLIGCVKKKLEVAAPAADLYLSPLFRGRRAYVGHSCERWFILSALHGLVRPDDILEPYDVTLNDATRGERHAWADRVLRQIDAELGSCQGLTFEIHAGANYVDYGLRSGLLARGAKVEEPVAGLKMGQQLAFYAGGHASASTVGPTLSRGDTETRPDREGAHAALGGHGGDSATAASQLGSIARAVRLCDWPIDLVGLDSPGLYAWSVDGTGAADLSRGLGVSVEPGPLYVGEAGATRQRSGKPSANTLRMRIQQMHRFGKVLTSTFRWTLAAVLFDELHIERRGKMALSPSSEDRLTAWMEEHLSIVVFPAEDADRLEELEHEVLEGLDPPFNLRQMPTSAVRTSLSELRRRISQHP